MDLYHGTTWEQWWKPQRGRTTIYLTDDPVEAAKYAYEQGERDELEGLSPKPLVLRVKLEDLEGLELGPDWGWSEATEATTWKESLEAVGSMSVTGRIEPLKKYFKRVPKKLWQEGRR